MGPTLIMDVSLSLRMMCSILTAMLSYHFVYRGGGSIRVPEAARQRPVSMSPLRYISRRRPFPFRWSPGKQPMHTVHVEDVAGAFWACAEWMDRVGGRAKADEIAGEEIPFKNGRRTVSPDEQIVISCTIQRERHGMAPWRTVIGYRIKKSC